MAGQSFADFLLRAFAEIAHSKRLIQTFREIFIEAFLNRLFKPFAEVHFQTDRSQLYFIVIVDCKYVATFE